MPNGTVIVSPVLDHDLTNFEDYSQVNWNYSSVPNFEVTNEPNNEDELNMTALQELKDNGQDQDFTYGNMQYELFNTLDRLYQMSMYNFGLRTPTNESAQAKIGNSNTTTIDEHSSNTSIVIENKAMYEVDNTKGTSELYENQADAMN